MDRDVREMECRPAMVHEARRDDGAVRSPHPRGVEGRAVVELAAHPIPTFEGAPVARSPGLVTLARPAYLASVAAKLCPALHPSRLLEVLRCHLGPEAALFIAEIESRSGCLPSEIHAVCAADADPEARERFEVLEREPSHAEPFLGVLILP
ncbi:MAG: hypothetical protein DYH08_16765, partial [Actinobacteria bacterium ATB1]|nr:hypothetical protein [Actinobacteria bacterium ATB1]